MEPILSAKKIRKCFNLQGEVEVLKDISLELFPGQSIAIMGASGEGKSTLLQILGTLEAPTSGELLIAGKAVTQNPPPILRNRHIGFVFQAFNLLEEYTVVQNVLMPALIGGSEIGPRSAAYARGVQLLEKVGLTHRLNYPAKLLSGGEKQRVCIARALCNDPEILLADEPSGNLDHKTSTQIHDLLIQAVKTLGKSLIVVTHDESLAALCDLKLILSDGQLLPSANPQK